MIFEELNFIARNKVEKVADVKEYKSNVLKEINQLTEKIDIAQAQKSVCIRIINRYVQIKEDYKNEIELKNKATELIKEDKKKKLRYR